jgi:hypothetical protein
VINLSEQSESSLIEDIKLREVEIAGGEDRLIVIDPLLFPLDLLHAILVESGNLHELVYEFLLDANCLVGADRVDSPFEAVFLRVVLGHKIGVVKGLNGRDLLHAHGCYACRH